MHFSAVKSINQSLLSVFNVNCIYKCDNIELAEVNFQYDLSIQFDKHLSFEEHIVGAIRKANIANALIKIQM